jgi:hypothetical protein
MIAEELNHPNVRRVLLREPQTEWKPVMIWRRSAPICPLRHGRGWLSGARPAPTTEFNRTTGGWLRGLGLGQYEATFRESDAEVLPDLTESLVPLLSVTCDQLRVTAPPSRSSTARGQEAVSLNNVVQRGGGETEPPGDFSRDSIGAVDNNRLFPSSQRGALAVLILTP